MVGVRQFDEEKVLDAVMDAFWRQGYAKTSMAELAAAAGIQRGSLYHAYGDKEDLLLRALDRYAARYGGAARQALKDRDPRQAIEAFLEGHIARMAAPENPAGCLMCQTAMECGGRDPVAGERVRKYFLRTETALRTALKRGRDSGHLPKDADVRALARFVLGTSRGMAVLHRAYGELAPVRDMARMAMRVLDGPRVR